MFRLFADDLPVEFFRRFEIARLMQAQRLLKEIGHGTHGYTTHAVASRCEPNERVHTLKTPKPGLAAVSPDSVLVDGKLH